MKPDELMPSDQKLLLSQLSDLIGPTNRAKPEDEDAKALEKFLDDHPDLWRISEDIQTTIAKEFISHMAPGPARRRLLLAEFQSLREELAQSAQSPLERQLADNVALCWLEVVYARHYLSLHLTQNPDAVDYWNTRVDTAQRRYLKATETLARIRRINLPAVQLNVAHNQVNQALMTGD